MTTEQYSIGYEAGYQDGWNEAQKPFVGLTDEEINALDYSGTRIEFVRAIEAKLKSKNYD